MFRSSFLVFSSTNSARNRLVGLAVVAAGLVGIVSQPATALTTGNLLTDPGFESNPLTSIVNVLNSPYLTNIWGDEASTITGAVGAVTPAGGTKMLSMTTDFNTVTQTLQMVDVSAYSAAINAGTATADCSAVFNVAQNVAAAQGGIYLQFMDSSHTFLPPTNINSQMVFDNNPSTWQLVGVSNIPIPINTKYLVQQVDYVDSTIVDSSGAGQAGYVDNASITLTTVPEPASVGLIVCGASSYLCMRRRRQIGLTRST